MILSGLRFFSLFLHRRNRETLLFNISCKFSFSTFYLSAKILSQHLTSIWIFKWKGRRQHNIPGEGPDAFMILRQI